MDVLEVSLQAKLMGSEGCGGVRVSSNKTADNNNNNCDKTRVEIERSISKKGGVSSGGVSDPSQWRKLMHSHDFVHDRLTKLRVESSSEPQNGYLPISSPESAESSRKRGKLSRSSSSNLTSKRSRLILLDDTVRDNDSKELCGQGSTLSDKPLAVKQRSSCNGRRSDKRTPKVLTRTFSTANTATGENAFFGAYGLKPDINDVTKLVEDLSLNKLLEGSYECPPLGKDKMKKLDKTNNDTLLSVVRNVWSVLPTRRPDHCVNPEIPSSPLNFPLCESSDVLKRLGLPSPKDLDSLLQDASKPSQNSKNMSDQQRSAKQLPLRGGLPHFPWSQAYNASSRTNSEAAKLLTGKTICQGRWLRIAETTMSSHESITNHFANLDSLTFNQSLVLPVQKQTGAGTKTTSCQCTEASVSTFQKASCVPTEAEGSRDVQDDARSCPQLLAAAQTLCDFAVQSGNHNNNPNGILRWPTKLSQKSMKARKSKLIETPLERHGTTESSSLHLISSSKKNNHVRKDSAALHNHHDRHHLPKPSKRLKLSTMENKKGSFPSSSASAVESDRKHSSSSKFKNHSRMMMPPPPPPTRTLQKSSTYPHKARRFPGIG
ncbi:hypothetical protein IGI04_034274 [Brassica rapa subsp. trilocularis]|uniref:DUF3741 domain-containing protein n=1 Tax=Brassica rapa subsp. trilocularis TaxID=1813537 RepID=A0ABQ7L891_BRACM|nr:hypothetical protein IGI04_034274 [Brassica rapa subsp. trilocularis]